MTVQEFIKQYGWGEARSFVNKTIELYGCITTLHYASNGYISVLVPHLVRDFDVSIKDLKQLVDAWELVNQFDDIEQAKAWIPAMDKDMPYCVKGSRVRFMRDELKIAIELVESVNE